MNPVTTILKALFLALIFTSPVASADNLFYDGGKIVSINHKYISLADRRYRLLATTKVRLNANKPGSILDLKAGDKVQVGMFKRDGKTVVDTIILIDR